MRNLLWELFEKTGDVRYYLLYSECRGINNESNSRGDRSK